MDVFLETAEKAWSIFDPGRNDVSEILYRSKAMGLIFKNTKTIADQIRDDRQ